VGWGGEGGGGGGGGGSEDGGGGGGGGKKCGGCGVCWDEAGVVSGLQPTPPTIPLIVQLLDKSKDNLMMANTQGQNM